MLFWSSKGKIDYIVAGLGNPGKKYENTRHNIGFAAADYIFDKCGGTPYKSKFKSLYTSIKISDKNVLLLKPQTFMNLSGEAIREAAKFYKISADKIIIIFDDVTLPAGRMRIRLQGSAGGHNGIKSIISNLNSQEFPRIKIGISDRPNPEWDLADWVLSKFSAEEYKDCEKVFENCYNALSMIVNGEIKKAMNDYN